MSRTKFNRETALENSTAVFWQHGFHGTSMMDILNATKLKPGSIYLAFGNKEGLYKECLDHYYELSLERIRENIDTAPSIGHGICSILETMMQESFNDSYCSCFLIKSQLEINKKQSELNTYIKQHLQNTEQQYKQYLEKEFDSNTASIYATSLMLHIFGIRVYGYQLENMKTLQQSVRQSLPWLPWKSHKQTLKQ